MEDLQALYPPAPPSQPQDAAFRPSPDDYDFVDGAWFMHLVRDTARGKSPDQWGWTAEMLRCLDQDLANAMAQQIVKPFVLGQLPEPYRAALAGGRLVPISKKPKPGVRPICVTDLLRRLAIKGLLRRCQHEHDRYFQNSHPRVFQFAGSNRNGATHMYHLFASIAADMKNDS